MLKKRKTSERIEHTIPAFQSSKLNLTQQGLARAYNWQPPVWDAWATKMTKALSPCSQGTKSMGDIHACKCISMLWVEIQRGRLNKRGRFKVQ